MKLRPIIGIPWCARCDKPVEQTACRLLDNVNAWELTVHCHGMVESVRVSMQEAVADRLVAGVAFQTPRSELPRVYFGELR